MIKSLQTMMKCHINFKLFGKKSVLISHFPLDQEKKILFTLIYFFHHS